MFLEFDDTNGYETREFIKIIVIQFSWVIFWFSINFLVETYNFNFNYVEPSQYVIKNEYSSPTN